MIHWDNNSLKKNLLNCVNLLWNSYKFSNNPWITWSKILTTLFFNRNCKKPKDSFSKQWNKSSIKTKLSRKFSNLKLKESEIKSKKSISSSNLKKYPKNNTWKREEISLSGLSKLVLNSQINKVNGLKQMSLSFLMKIIRKITKTLKKINSRLFKNP